MEAPEKLVDQVRFVSVCLKLGGYDDRVDSNGSRTWVAKDSHEAFG